MDRRSWLWRKKSSEKSPGETESSGSISSHSERFSDDQVYAIHNSQSPEVTSKQAPNDEDTNDIVKGLTEKLSSALLSLSAKEDSVKQHAKVAEEAVAGWEKAENEVADLKQQLEVLTQKHSSLDGALKECVRQLRQAREVQEQKTQEAIDKRSHEWESTKSELESQLIQLQVKLETATTEASASLDHDLRSRLGALEKENASLKQQLFSQSKELKMATIERDLSTQAAEASSKQHLEDIRKVGKLEAECRRLKAIVSKASTSSATDSKSFVGSSVETDKHGVVNAEFNQAKYDKACRRNHAGPTVDVKLMDDFLEMERLAGLPDIESESCSVVSSLKAELEAMIDRTAELEEKLEDMEEEKARLEISLTECQKQLETSESQLMEAELKFRQLRIQLALTDGSKQSAEEESKASKMKAEAAESELRTVKAEVRKLSMKIDSLEVELRKERALSTENLAKCQKLEDEVEKKQAFSSEILAKCSKLEDEVSSMKCNAELQQEALVHNAAKSNGELKIKQEKELAVAAGKFAECQKTIASLGRQLKCLASLEDFLMDEKSQELTTEASK